MDEDAVQAMFAAIWRTWRGGLHLRQRAGLPELAWAALGVTGPRAKLRRSAKRLDETTPGWVERAAAAASEAAMAGDGGERIAVACALVGTRPLRDTEALGEALYHSMTREDSRFWLLLAHAGTDTADVRSTWRHALTHWQEEDNPDARSISWLAFVRCLLGGWLSWSDFREAVAVGRLQAAAGEGPQLRRALEAVGIWSHPRFARWYRQAVYEASHQPDVTVSFETVNWIRDFPGEGYLWQGLSMLEERLDNWWPLYLVRWSSGCDPDSPATRARLAELSPVTLCALSVLRPDFAEAVGAALGSPLHAAAVSWLTGTKSRESVDLEWVEGALKEWARVTGGPFVEAMGGLCSLTPPQDYLPRFGEDARRRSFLRSQLVPEMNRLMDNLLYVHAVRGRHFGVILREARRRRPAAVRALALWPTRAKDSAPTLLELARGAAGPFRDAARETLAVLAARAGAQDLAEFERRMDLAEAWADGGLEGKWARVWDIAGYRVRLAMADGEVVVRVFSSHRPLAGVPDRVRRHHFWQEVVEAKARLAEQQRYFRQRMEEGMTAGIRYAGRDFSLLLHSPVVRSLASRLVLRMDGEEVLWTFLGEPNESLPPARLYEVEEVEVVHPVYLAKERIIRERIAQPFKQVFREVYLLGEEEAGRDACERFAGHRIRPRQAFALLKQRGYAPKRGMAVKEWHSCGVRAYLEWAGEGEEAGKLLGSATGRAADATRRGPAGGVQRDAAGCRPAGVAGGLRRDGVHLRGDEAAAGGAGTLCGAGAGPHHGLCQRGLPPRHRAGDPGRLSRQPGQRVGAPGGQPPQPGHHPDLGAGAGAGDGRGGGRAHRTHHQHRDRPLR